MAKIFSNLFWTVIWTVLAILTLYGVVFLGATWHIPTLGICCLMAWTMYTDKAYGTSVREYFKSRRGKGRAGR